MSRTIAVTGATGFAGRHAVAALLDRGHRVRALVRNPAAAQLPPQVETVAGDLGNGAALEDLLRGADAVVHLAGAIAGLRRQDYFDVNAEGTLALARAARKLGLPRFVHISSLSAREPGLSHYGASKRAGEDAIAAQMSRLNAIIIRPPAVYGPGDKATLPLFKELTRKRAAIPGRPDARFSLIHVGDLARLAAVAAEGAQSGLHEVSDQTEGGYRWSDLLAVAEAAEDMEIKPYFLPRAIPFAAAIAAEAWSRITGRPGMVNRGKIRELYHPDWVSRQGALKLSNPVSFARGFPETVAWYRMAGWLPRKPPADRTARSS